ncbi:MAG: Rrf2 family transcriptional regulator [Chitinophagales bacterium]|nr:Rrf2 family transcriptional regulator [Chitinophagales bacterium]MCZ2393721.1 Rrf2 family transcriptional regulator [Chitinophagales bacterium]
MLSKKSKYAIHALVYLAKKYEKGPILISEISETQHIPKKFLETILLDLRNSGILNSKKGKGGGYYLIKSPSDINLADVVRLFEGAIALLPCVTHRFYEPCVECQDEFSCGVRDVFMEIRNETVEILKKSTLEDIIRREENLLKLEHPH